MSGFDIDKKTAYIQSLFQESQNERNAQAMSAYMKNRFIFYGVKSPKRKEVLSLYWRDFKEPVGEDLFVLFQNLWDDPHRELQYLAMDIMKKLQKHFDASSLDFFTKLLRSKSWWDTVDFLASNPIGNVLYRHPELIDPYTESWMESGNMWLQRTCLLYQLKYKQDLDFERLERFILRLKGSDEFFINKAIGWALRQHSKHDAATVRDFLNRHSDLSGLSVREASKYL